MTRDDIDGLTRRFLDGELTEDEERDALCGIAEDAEARALLRFDMRLRSRLVGSGSGAAPSDFTDRVMREISRVSVPAPAARSAVGGEVGRLAALWTELRRLRTLQWRLGPALLAVAGLVLIASAVIAVGGIPAGSGPWLALRPAEDPSHAPPADEGPATRAQALGAPSVDTVLVRFVLEDPSARSVAVAGDFSQWRPIPLVPHRGDGEAVWTAVVPLARGEHRYMFVIDGSRWVTDPLASAYWDDGFGNRNAVLSL